MSTIVFPSSQGSKFGGHLRCAVAVALFVLAGGGITNAQGVPTPETPCVGWPLPAVQDAAGNALTVQALKALSPFSSTTAKVDLWVVYKTAAGMGTPPQTANAATVTTWDDWRIVKYVPGFLPPPGPASPPGSHPDELKWKKVGFTDTSAVGVIIQPGLTPPDPKGGIPLKTAVLLAVAGALTGIIIGWMLAKRSRQGTRL